MIFYVYRINLDKNASDIIINPGDDFAQIEWFDIAELKKTKLTPPLIELLSRIEILI